MNAFTRQLFLERRAATIVFHPAEQPSFNVRRSEPDAEAALQGMPRIDFAELSTDRQAERGMVLWIVDWHHRSVGGVLLTPLSAGGMRALMAETLGRHRHWRGLQPEAGRRPDGFCLVGLVGRSCVGVGVRQALAREAADRRPSGGIWACAGAPHERALLAALGFRAAFADACTVMRYERGA